MKVGYTFTKLGLQVAFRDISREVPIDSTYHWDFGDSIVAEADKNPVHSFGLPGFYVVILSITIPAVGDVIASTLTYTGIIGVSTLVKTILSDTIYNLIDLIVPKEFIIPVNYESQKRVYIEKWQLYIQPLVNHEVPEEEYNNELYFEALENQLIMELAVYDWLTVRLASLLGSLASINAPTVESNSGDIKHIIAGPSEVEFYDNGDAAYKTIVNATKKDGLMDIIRHNLCALAARLDIYIPICSMLPKDVYAPKVINRRNPGLIGGPDPSFPVKGPARL